MTSKQEFLEPTQECTDYQPIQYLKNISEAVYDTTEDAGCDTCVHYQNNHCKIYLK